MPTLRAGDVFGPWTVEVCERSRVRVVCAPGVARKQLGRHLVTALGSTALALALAEGDWVGDLRVVTLPFAGLLLFVALLGLLSAVRSGRRVLLEVHLEADAKAGTVSGFPEPRGSWRDWLDAREVVELAALKAVVLTSHLGGADSRVAVGVRTAAGRLLEGPALVTSEAKLAEARALLTPLAEALASVTGKPVQQG